MSGRSVVWPLLVRRRSVPQLPGCSPVPCVARKIIPAAKPTAISMFLCPTTRMIQHMYRFCRRFFRLSWLTFERSWCGTWPELIRTPAIPSDACALSLPGLQPPDSYVLNHMSPGRGPGGHHFWRRLRPVVVASPGCDAAIAIRRTQTRHTHCCCSASKLHACCQWPDAASAQRPSCSCADMMRRPSWSCW